jgi:hypothetical protein
MKFIHTLAFLLLIGYIICDETTCRTEANPTVDNCKKINVDGGHCCYYESPKRTTYSKGCTSITNYEYDNIKTYAKYEQTFGGDNKETEDKDAKIDCKSFFLQFTSIILILLLL